EAVRGRDGSGGAGRARSGVAAQRSAEGERGRDRRDGYRQGLSQRRGGEADEGVRCAHLHSGEETKGAAELGGQAGGATGGVCEPAAGAGRVRQEFTAAARRIRRAQLRALLRDGRDAALPSARTRKHSEAAVSSCGRVQSEPGPAQAAGRGHTAGTEKPRRTGIFSSLAFSAPDNVAFACPATDRRCWRAPYILFPSPHASSLLTNFQQFYHGLIGPSLGYQRVRGSLQDCRLPRSAQDP